MMLKLLLGPRTVHQPIRMTARSRRGSRGWSYKHLPVLTYSTPGTEWDFQGSVGVQRILHAIGSPIIMEICYRLRVRQMAPEHVIMMTQLMPESGPTVREEILFPFWSKRADGESLRESRSRRPQMAGQMEKNEIPCRGSHLPKLWGLLTPACPPPACRHTFQEAV